MNSAITGSTADHAAFFCFAVVKDSRFTCSFPVDVVLKFEKIATKNSTLIVFDDRVFALVTFKTD